METLEYLREWGPQSELVRDQLSDCRLRGDWNVARRSTIVSASDTPEPLAAFRPQSVGFMTVHPRPAGLMSPKITRAPSKRLNPVHSSVPPGLRICAGRAAPDWDTLVHCNVITYLTQSTNIDIAPFPLSTDV